MCWGFVQLHSLEWVLPHLPLSLSLLARASTYTKNILMKPQLYFIKRSPVCCAVLQTAVLLHAWVALRDPGDRFLLDIHVCDLRTVPRLHSRQMLLGNPRAQWPGHPVHLYQTAEQETCD